MKSRGESKGKSQLNIIIAALLLLMVAAPIIYLLGCKFTSGNVKVRPPSTTIREMAASPSTPASRGTSKQNVQPIVSTSTWMQAQKKSSTSAGAVTIDPSTGLPIGAGAGGVGAGGGLPGRGKPGQGGPAYQQQTVNQALMEAARALAQTKQMTQRLSVFRPNNNLMMLNELRTQQLYQWYNLPPKQQQSLLQAQAAQIQAQQAARRHDLAKRLVAGPQGSMPSLEEELWVIAKPSGEKAQAAEDDLGSGALMAKLPDQVKQIALPLKHTAVAAAIDGYIASVEVIQKFNNPYDSKIEAVYMFPLPQNSAVNEFIMVIGDRRIRGIIRDRKEAETIYANAKRQGYTASLLTQERPNIFTQKVANIEPGKNIDIHIKYFNTLSYRDGWYEFVFPMVVGPRFNPPGSTDGIGAVARGRHGTSGQKNEVQYLKPAERSGHDIALNVNLNTGVAIEEITSTNHKITEAGDRLGLRKISITKNDRIPNKDFVLRYRVAGKRIKSNLLTHKDKNGQYFTMMLYPPADLKALERQPVELIFVLDCSGSMGGQPITQAKAAVRQGLGRLNPQDTFQIIRFSNNASQLGPSPLKATEENIKKGLNYLSQLNSGGGTMMIEGIKAALDFAHDENHLRFVCFLTDGYIGNESQIIGEVHKRISNSRIFSFGVGSSPNRYLMNRMAKLGRGAVSYLSLKDDGAKVMDEFFDSISHPALTDIKINWGALKVKEMYPARIPDLFVGRPVILTGRFEGKMPAEIRVNGMTGGEATQVVIKASMPESGAGHEGIPSVWARMKISDLADRSTYTPNMELPDQIKEIALNYNLLSAFTAFVAVDSSRRTKDNTGTTVSQAVPVPKGVKYSTTVPGN